MHEFFFQSFPEKVKIRLGCMHIVYIIVDSH